MEWSDLRIFLSIARLGSLSGASRKLGLSQPTVGRRLKALEESLNRTLVQRTPEGLVLTDEGTRLLGRVERMEREALGIERQTLVSSQWEGRLKVGASDWFGSRVLPPVLAEFSRDHPRVVLEVLTDHRLASLNRRQNDVSFRIVPFTEPDVIARRLLTMPYGVYASHDHPTSWAPDGEGVRVLTLPSSLSHIADVAWIRTKLPRATVGLRSNHREVLAALCALGAGLAVLPRPLGDATKGLVLVDLGDEPPALETWMGYHRDQGNSPLVRAFVDLALRRLGNPQPGP